MRAQIPVVDIRDYQTDRTAFVARIGAAYREYGFCGITGHGIAPASIDDAYGAFRRFFALPEAVKLRYRSGVGGARGYTPFGVETAKDAQYHDLKEFWHIGRDLPAGSRYAPLMPPNLWPAEVPEFRDCAKRLYAALDALGARVLRALALHIGLPETWFDDKIDQGNSILRAIHYPPIAQADAPNVRAGEHEDINLITLLVGASAEGLQIKRRDGEWLPVTTQGDVIVVNIGDMLQRWTNHVYPSTTHRVVNPPGEKARQPRYSAPFFLHPNPDVALDPLPQTITADNPNRYPQSLTANDYLQQRLREIKLVA